jgi:hypothetical protein
MTRFRHVSNCFVSQISEELMPPIEKIGFAERKFERSSSWQRGNLREEESARYYMS